MAGLEQGEYAPITPGLMNSKYIRVGGWGNQDWCTSIITGKQHQRHGQGGGKIPLTYGPCKAQSKSNISKTSQEGEAGAGAVLAVRRVAV